MKKLAILVPVFFVAACETAPTGPLAVDQFIGKELVGPNATFLFNADGTVGGTFRGDPIVGTSFIDLLK